MTVKIITLGCKVNQYESQAMLEALLAAAFTQAAPDEAAGVVVVNSCTVTAQSDHKVRQALRRAKKDNPGAVTVLTGCMPQAFPDAAAALLEADIVLGNTKRSDLVPRLQEFLATKQRVVDIAPHVTGEPFEPLHVSEFHGRTRAFLKIQDGCDRFCAYCIIPYARGRVRSKALEDIRQEVAQLGQAGYKEVVLTGINLPAYGKELGLHLCDAVEAACEATGIQRVRLGSLEPEQLTPEVIARMASQDKLCPQFHLSLQSGCDATLRRMNRHYTTAEYGQIVGNLREAFPGCAITTDVMVGFAGETEEEFEASLSFVRKIGFSKGARVRLLPPPGHPRLRHAGPGDGAGEGGPQPPHDRGDPRHPAGVFAGAAGPGRGSAVRAAEGAGPVGGLYPQLHPRAGAQRAGPQRAAGPGASGKRPRGKLWWEK